MRQHCLLKGDGLRACCCFPDHLPAAMARDKKMAESEWSHVRTHVHTLMPHGIASLSSQTQVKANAHTELKIGFC